MTPLLAFFGSLRAVAPLCLAGGVLASVAAPAGEVSVEVGITRIDGTTLTGVWAGAPDGYSVRIHAAGGAVIIPIDALMEISFGASPDAPGDTREESARAAPQTSGEDSVPAVFFLADGGRLNGELLAVPEPRSPPNHTDEKPAQTGDVLMASTPLGPRVLLPFDRLAGVQLADFDSSFHHEAQFPRARAAFFSALSSRLPGHDVLTTRDVNLPKTLRGRLESLGPRNGTFSFSDRLRSFRTEKIFGIVFAAGPALAQQTPYQASFTLMDGSVVSGRVEQANAASLRVATSLGFDADLPLASDDPAAPGLAAIQVHSDRVVYLSDLEPAGQRTDGLLHRPWPARFDRSVAGGPISLGGRVFEKGLGVHSRTELTYKLGGAYEAFAATIGIDDAVRPRGSVLFRVLGDATVLYEGTQVTGSDRPRDILIDVTGVDLLTLVVDYGDDLDLSDHADWGGARVLRPATTTDNRKDEDRSS